MNIGIKYLEILILFVLMILSCATWRTSLNKHGDNYAAVRNAVIDFSHTSRLFRHDSIFSVRVMEFESGIIGVSLIGTTNKLFVDYDGKPISNFPTRYIKYKDKLFYWYDENHSTDSIIIENLNQYNMIDTVESFAFAEWKIDDGDKAIAYYFCKKNLLNYKKVKSSIAMGSYPTPMLNCNTE